jgi:hypothetical protein
LGAGAVRANAVPCRCHDYADRDIQGTGGTHSALANGLKKFRVTLTRCADGPALSQVMEKSVLSFAIEEGTALGVPFLGTDVIA